MEKTKLIKKIYENVFSREKGVWEYWGEEGMFIVVYTEPQDPILEEVDATLKVVEMIKDNKSYKLNKN